MTPGHDVALEERLDELRHELAEVRVKAVDVLRPLALGEVGLRPRERQVDPAVQRLLRRGHGRLFGAHGPGPRRQWRPRAASSAWRRAIRTGIGGCVEKSDATPPPESGFAM